MFWIYALLLTAGVVAIVPTVLRSIDDLPGDTLTGAIGFGGVSSGVIGLFLWFGSANTLWTFLLAMAVGLAAAALHTELLARIRPRADRDADYHPDHRPDHDTGHHPDHHPDHHRDHHPDHDRVVSESDDPGGSPTTVPQSSRGVTT